MYESFYAFQRRPFPAAPTTDLYFPGAASEQARTTLVRLIERAEGAGLLIGAAGTGKTLLCQVLAEHFRDRFQVASLTSARLCTRRALLQAILYSLGRPYRERAEGELRLALIDYLTGRDVPGNAVVLLVDEADGLPLRLLEEIRQITNLTAAGLPRVRLVLAGSQLLEERLSHPKLESFHQRIAARCYLSALEAQETSQYVTAQIAAARGTTEPLFTPAALTAVHRATEGVPRLINQVCDHALVLAFAAGQRMIDEDGIQEAWADLQQLPLPARNVVSLSAARQRAVVEFGALDDLDQAEVRAADEADGAADEDLAEAIPFPGRLAAHRDVENQVERIAQQLAGLEDDFMPVGTIGPEIELNFGYSPALFGSDFSEEEVVIDRYAALDENYLRSRPRVTNRAGDRISEFAVPPTGSDLRQAKPTPPQQPMRAAGNFAAQPSLDFDRYRDARADYDPVMPEGDSARHDPPAAHLATHGSRELPPDDRDMITIEDEPLAAPRVRRQEYRQLFARLRRSS